MSLQLFQAREHHTWLHQLLVESGTVEGSAAHRDESQWNAARNDKYRLDVDFLKKLRFMAVDSTSALAANHLSAAARVLDGEYLFSFLPLLRSSVEASIHGCWLLGRVAPHQRLARLLLDALGGATRMIDASPTAARRQQLKKDRRDLRRRVERMIPPEDLDDGGGGWIGEDTRILGEAPKSISAKFDELGEGMTDGESWRPLYDSLSLFAHPNPMLLGTLTSAEANSWYCDVGGLLLGARNALIAYYQLVRCIYSYFDVGAQESEDWIEQALRAFPGTDHT